MFGSRVACRAMVASSSQLLCLCTGVYAAAGCFVFCTRDGLEAVGGWDETLFAAEEVYLSRALRRYSRFVILPQHVITSGRKLRAHSGREILGGLLRLGLDGRKAMGRRKGLEIWYGDRRKEPG